MTFGGTAATNVAGGEQHDHHGHNSGRQCRSGDRDGDSEWAEWKSGERIHLRSCAHGEQCISEQRSAAGGTAVTITGTNFAAGATVTFGGTAATNVVVVNSTTITATTPAGSAGAVTVTVTVNGQSGSLTNGFTYVVPPTVSSVSPNSGSTAGGTAVTITGTNFAAGATVTFGATAATNVVVVNSTTITATTPAGSAGAVTVTVTQSGCTEREFDERVHLCRGAHGEQRISE